MELYTLKADFTRDKVVEDYNSVIWTERYSSAGETSLVVDATPENIAKYTPGTYLAKGDSKEVMLLETQSVEEGLLTVEGKSLLAFLNQRWARTGRAHSNQDFTVTVPAGAYSASTLIAGAVTFLCFPGYGLVGEGTPRSYNGMYGSGEAIPNIGSGSRAATDPIIYNSGIVNEVITVGNGPLYDLISGIAGNNDIGIDLYLDNPTSLLFDVYTGDDHTSDGDHTLVRFSSVLDNLDNIKELDSLAVYKNVCYVYVPGLDAHAPSSDTIVIFAEDPPVATRDGLDASLDLGFGHRTMVVYPDDLADAMKRWVADTYLTDDPDSDMVLAWWAAVGQDAAMARGVNALANNNYTHVVDGEVVEQSQYQFGTHYLMGDIIELQGTSGALQKARITEYISSKDETGEKNYPTVSVLV